MKSFDEWLDEDCIYNESGENVTELIKDYTKSAWDYKQKEIDSLKAQIELLEKAVDFYAYRDNWDYSIEGYGACIDGISPYDLGNLALQTKQKLEKLRKGNR